MAYHTADFPQRRTFALGCAALPSVEGPSLRHFRALISQAVELGIRTLDTADVYGEMPGASEEFLGRAIAGTRRDLLTISTKVGLRVDALKQPEVDLTPSHIRRGCIGSLKRLNVDYIDILFLHRADPKRPVEEAAAAVGELIRDGYVRSFGLSEVSLTTLRRAHAITPVEFLQSEYSLITRNLEGQMLPWCSTNGVMVLAYRALSRGLLAANGAAVARRSGPRFVGQNLRANLAIATTIEKLAKNENATAAQISLAWMYQKSSALTPLVGVSSIDHLIENARAASLELSADTVAVLDQLIEHVSGERYTSHQMALIQD